MEGKRRYNPVQNSGWSVGNLMIQNSPFQGHNKYTVESQKPALSEAKVRNVMWLVKFFALLNFIYSLLLLLLLLLLLF